MNKQYIQHTLASLNIAVIKAKIHYKQRALCVNVSELVKLDLMFSPTYTKKLVSSPMRAED